MKISFSFLQKQATLSHVHIGKVERNVASDIAGDIAPYLLTLANRKQSYLCHVAQGGRGHYRILFANVNDPLLRRSTVLSLPL